MTERAAQWTARLLPFASLLSHTEHSDIDHTLLTLLAELPCDSFLVDLAAFCYPSAPSAPESLAGRFDRFMAKLRSHSAGPSHGPQFHRGVSHEVESGDPISVRYHIQSQRVLTKQQQFGVSLTFESSVGQALRMAALERASITADQEATSGVKDRLKDKILPSHVVSSLPKLPPASPKKQHSGKGEKPCTGSTIVGSYLFEHDRDYIRFVDTFFELILSDDAHSSALEHSPRGLGISPQGRGVEPDQPPFLGMYWNVASSEAGTTTGPCWAQVVPLVSLLHEWTLTQLCDLTSFGANTSVAGPAKKPAEGRVTGRFKARATHPHSWGGKQGERPFVMGTPASLLVEVPAGQLVHALRLEEGRRVTSGEEGGERCGSLEGVTVQDRVCQEEEREKYLQTLRSLEVENGAAAPPSGGSNQDGGSGEWDDVSVSSVASGAPSSVHASRVWDEHQPAEDVQQASLSPAVPDKPVVPQGQCRGGGSGSVGGTSPYPHHVSQVHSVPLLQVPPDTLKVILIIV